MYPLIYHLTVHKALYIYIKIYCKCVHKTLKNLVEHTNISELLVRGQTELKIKDIHAYAMEGRGQKKQSTQYS